MELLNFKDIKKLIGKVSFNNRSYPLTFKLNVSEHQRLLMYQLPLNMLFLFLFFFFLPEIVKIRKIRDRKDFLLGFS